MGNYVIEMSNISKSYGNYDYKSVALNNISLKIKKGEMIAIMGPSGSGKSTLLNIMGCLDIPTEGKYNLCGEKINELGKKGLAEIRNKKLGFVFQNFALLDDHSVYENVEIPLIYRNTLVKPKLIKKEIRNKVTNILKEVKVDSHMNKLPSQLSGGQQQRVAIARALVGETEIILADEPTGALDQKTGKEIMDLLIKINESGRTMIIVTHDINITKRCKRLIELRDGVIVKDETIS